jgi:hemolysin III
VVDDLKRGAERAADAMTTARENATEAMARGRENVAVARDNAAEAMASARENVAAARDNAAEAVATAKENAAEAIAKVKPKLRGVFHEYAFPVALLAGVILILAAPSGKAQLAAGIYAFSLAALLGTSALYHRVDWKRPGIRLWVRRLDHSMIFLLIAGTITPFALLILHGAFADAMLIAVWAGAAVGIVVELIWVQAPKWISVAVYVGVGWIGAIAFPAIAIDAGIGAAILIAVGGVLYTTGAVIYARESPNPNPAVFGYHEIFHVLVLAAATVHFAAIALYALPAG